MTKTDSEIPNIIIVGGGAGGLELATELGKNLSRKKLANITLVDTHLTHLWKPLWHEVAAGTLNSYEDEINYISHANTHYFNFQLGKMKGLDRENKMIYLEAVYDHKNQEIIPERQLDYYILVMAVGSVSNDFDTPGVKENCLFLDSQDQAKDFQQVFLKAIMRSQNPNNVDPFKPIQCAIVGGGATGVELATELYYAAEQAAHYELTASHHNIKLTIIEASNTVLSGLPSDLITVTTSELKKRKIDILTHQRVNRVDHNGFHTVSGLFIPAEIKVWAAGIKAPEFLKNLDGLEVNKVNQLVVKPTLQTTLDPAIYAFGDCAACTQLGTDKLVPPRAQAAHQQAIFLAKNLCKAIHNQPLNHFIYNSRGSLISISHQVGVGNVIMWPMGQFMLSGKLARFAYLFLYKLHQITLYGKWRVFLISFANLITRPIRPRLKLH